MRKKDIETKRIRLGKVTYFDTKNNGSRVPEVDAYVLLIKLNGIYINPFNLADEMPIYDRVPYSNTTRGGEDYGTKIVHVQGKEEDGRCIVLDTVKGEELFGEGTIELDQLEEYVIQSNKFFIDRIDLLDKRTSSFRKRNYYNRKTVEDLKSMMEFNYFMNECGEEVVRYIR